MLEPPDPMAAPRFTGPRTYARLPHTTELAGADCAVFGMPWDGATTFRPGARFGPEGVRSASVMVRTYNTAQRVQVLGAGTGERIGEALSCIDFGDAPTVPGYVEETLRRIEAFVRPIVAAGVIPVGIGGDHSVTLAELRALAATTGPLGLVHIDSHGDLWDDTFGMPYNHGTMFRRAIEEGVLDPARVIQAGIRGPLYVEEDTRLQDSMGVELITWLELCELDPGEFAERVRARVGDGPTFLTFDVDFVDGAFLPGTGTPEIGGPTPHQALQCLRALDGLSFRGFDLVEVSPPYDGPGQMTALFGAQAVFEMLSLVACARARARRRGVP
jgi:agmatinase